MNDWQYFFNRVDDNLATSNYRIFDELSKTEIFHWFSREDVTKEQKEDFIQDLVEFKDDCGGFYHYRAYLLAAEALNYFKDCSRGDAIALQILKWSYAFFRQDKQDWQIVPQPLVEAARVAVETTDRQRVISAFVHLIHTTQSRHTLHIAAEKLGKLDPGNKSAIAALVLLLQVAQDECLNTYRITYSLMQIAKDNPAVIPTLVKLIQANANGWFDVYRCHWYTVDIANRLVINALAELKQTTIDGDDDDIVCAIHNLEKIALGNETAINALIELMQTTVDKYICSDAVTGLGKIAPGNQTAIAAITEFLQINQGDLIRLNAAKDFRQAYLCLNAAKALWQIDKGNANAIAILVQIVAADKFNWSDCINDLLQYVSCEAAASLLKFDPRNELAIATLSQIIQSSDYIRYHQRTADSLLNIDSYSQVAIDTLFAVVKYLGQSPSDPEDAKSNAWDAIESLQKIDSSNQLAISALVNLLDTAQKDSDLYIAVQGLGSFAAGNKDALAALTKLLDRIEEDNDFLRYIASKLGSIDPGNQRAISTLVEFIQTFDEWNSNAQNSQWWWCSDSQLLDAADKLQEILPINQMPQVVVALKDYLVKSNRDSSYRYEACYRVIWHCAQNMTYPDFYAAWHKLP